MTERPHRSVSRLNYAELADVKVPKRSRVGNKGVNTVREVDDTSRPLYRLEIIEEDTESSDRVKIRYIGYGSQFDEWRQRSEIVELSENDTDDGNEQPSMAASSTTKSNTPPRLMPYSLVVVVAHRIKDLLISSRRGSPVCTFIMPFDKVVFDSLAIRGVVERCEVHRPTRKTYTIPHLNSFDDLFGERWYIRGLNLAGDFCYVTPGSVEFSLKQRKGKADYQLQADGTLLKKYYGECYQLAFSFIRGDGTSSQWHEVLRQCNA